MKINGITYQVRAKDYAAAQEWYAKFLGRSPDFLPYEGFVGEVGFCEWKLMSEAECWLQVAEGEPAIGSGPIRFGVNDIHAHVARVVQSLGLPQPEIGTTPDGQVNYCTFTDPFGNRIGLFQDLQEFAQDWVEIDSPEPD